jgi:hypothetical protein
VVLFASCGSFQAGAPLTGRGMRRIRQNAPLPSPKGVNNKSGLMANEAPVKIPMSVSLFHLDFFEPLPIRIEASNAGLLLLRQLDEFIGLTKQSAAMLHDPELTEHTNLEIVRMRVLVI